MSESAAVRQRLIHLTCELRVGAEIPPNFLSICTVSGEAHRCVMRMASRRKNETHPMRWNRRDVLGHARAKERAHCAEIRGSRAPQTEGAINTWGEKQRR